MRAVFMEIINSACCFACLVYAESLMLLVYVQIRFYNIDLLLSQEHALVIIFVPPGQTGVKHAPY